MEDLKELRKIESGVSRNLFIVCAIVTLVTMALLTIDFFSRGSFVPARINFFYLAIVAIYALHKELLRWLGDKKSKRNGEYFVYSWIILTTALYVVNFFYHDLFSYSVEGYRVGTLRDVSFLTIEVLGIFIFTRFLKLLEALRKKNRSA